MSETNTESTMSLTEMTADGIEKFYASYLEVKQIISMHRQWRRARSTMNRYRRRKGEEQRLVGDLPMLKIHMRCKRLYSFGLRTYRFAKRVMKQKGEWGKE